MNALLRRTRLAVLLLLTGLSPRAAVAITLPPTFIEHPVASGLSNPTAMAFAPDGRLFVCEQGGRLRVIRDGMLLAAPFLTVAVDSSGERGLLGVAFDPDFATNSFVYVYYTATTPTIHNRVSRFIASGDVAVGGSEVVLLDIADSSSASNHNGGALRFARDGTLLIAVGERAQASNSQTLSNLLGKVLRLNRDGTIPTDNPFYASATGVNRAIWVLGLRNPFTFDVHPRTGRVFINDVGGGSREEINDGVAGSNYGWPDTEGSTSDPRYRSPLYSYGHDSTGGCAIVGSAFYDPPLVNFPSSYVGQYFFADLCNNWIRRLDPANGNTVETFATQTVGNPVDLEVGPDGNLYYLARSGGVVRRISFGVDAPTITTPPASQTVPLDDPVTFSLTASGAGPLSYQWQRNGSNILGATARTYTIDRVALGDSGARFRCRVSNVSGSVMSAEATLTVTNNRRPLATIATPADGSLYSGGQTISFSGTATDSEDGTLGAAAFTWVVDFHHDTHTHPHLPATSGITSGSFTVPVLGETATNVWFRIHLSVVDSAGLTRNVFRDVRPRVARMTLATNPSGLRVSLDGQPQTAPFAFDAVAGMSRAIGTPAIQTSGGNTWRFVSWSDGGAGTHDVTVPTAPVTLTATYQQIFLPGTPTLASPTGTLDTQQPTYRWNAVAGAEEYYLWVNNPAGTPVVQIWYLASVCSGATCSATPATRLMNGAHTWWIQARNPAGAGLWSAGMGFTVSTPGRPVLVSPNGGTTGFNPAYTWNAVNGATDYYLWVNNAASAPVVQTWYVASAVCSGATCSVTPGTRLMNGAHTWWVQARGPSGDGLWSAPMDFTASILGRPVLLSPNGGTTGFNPAYTWNAVSGATDYYLWVNNAANTPVVQTWHTSSAVCSGATCSVTPTAPLARGAHQWWVQARSAAGSGLWSDAFSFTVDLPVPGVPTLVSPNGTTGANPTYTWNPVAGAVDYYLWVNNAMDTPLVQEWRAASLVCASSVCSWTPSTRLANGAHTWWIQARSAAGTGLWSAGMSFSVSATGTRPPVPVTVSPSGTGSRTPQYTWNVASGATDYWLWVDDGSGRTVLQVWALSVVCSVSTCSFTPAGTLAAGSHTWWVLARNAAGASLWSAPRSFVAQ